MTLFTIICGQMYPVILGGIEAAKKEGVKIEFPQKLYYHGATDTEGEYVIRQNGTQPPQRMESPKENECDTPEKKRLYKEFKKANSNVRKLLKCGGKGAVNLSILITENNLIVSSLDAENKVIQTYDKSKE